MGLYETRRTLRRMWSSMIDIYQLEKIKRITRKWEINKYELTHDDLHKMLSDIRELVK